jgi:hypothetical protein
MFAKSLIVFAPVRFSFASCLYIPPRLGLPFNCTSIKVRSIIVNPPVIMKCRLLSGYIIFTAEAMYASLE